MTAPVNTPATASSTASNPASSPNKATLADTAKGNIAAQRLERCRKSADLYQRANRVFPSGVTHDSRFHQPFPLYVTHAKGARKWDVDGNEYVDYRMGHGALILGHNHPAVTAALVEQAQKGTHYGACHELEVRWAELVQQIVPSAERVKFLSSGTEATMMALRMARAFTGREKIIKVQGGFHGWHDYATVAMSPPYDIPLSKGVPPAVAGTILAVPPRDPQAIERTIVESGDVAGVILIAGSTGKEYLQAVRDITRRHGVILIYDEVVTGFRYAPGGCQEHYGVVPDVTTLAKILAGGLPGACIAARADLLDLFKLDPDDAEWTRFGRIHHPGTFNGSPLSAAAGIACLEIVKDPAIQRRATATADQIRAGLTGVFQRHGVEVHIGGEMSMLSLSFQGVKRSGPAFDHALRAAVQLFGVDYSGSLIVSAVHDAQDVAQTVEAFDGAVDVLQQDGWL